MDLTWLDGFKSLAQDAARLCGCELFDVEHRQSGRRWLVRVVLDRLDGPVTIGDCEAVSRQLSAKLDVEDVIPHSFDLEVSSPGAERPLREPRDYERFAGKPAKLVLGPGGPDAGQVWEGEVAGFEGDEVRMIVDGEIRQVAVARVKSAHLVLRFP